MKNFRTFLTLALCGVAAFLLACGGSSHPSNVIATSGPNVAAITVNGGPVGNYVDAAFTSVTVCVPGTSTCQTINDILVDTGSPGLRIVSSVLNIALPQQKTTGGNPIVECLPFVASYTWGPVETADVEIASEKASAVPIQVLSDTDFTVPTACSSPYPPNSSADTVTALGANGILGVGLLAQDCGTGPECVTTGSAGLYYQCPSQACATTGTLTGEALAQQVTNPVALFATDNNGVIVELPRVSAVQATVSGSLVFGIGTQSNNGLGGATVIPAPAGSLTAIFNGQSYPASFIDSGSNGYFFLDTNLPSLPLCSGAEQGFYCPNSTQSFSATNQGSSETINFSIADAATLLSPNESVYADLGGQSGGPPPGYFDWGLPFFYGRNVFVAIEGTSAPGGQTPYWAY